MYGNGLLDQALTLYLPKPNTYTGQDLLELHLHGGVAIIKSVLKTIKQLHDPDNGKIIRQAEPGEFSKLAFMNNKLNLVELEGISDIIDAETESQRVATLASITGKTTSEFNRWRQEILNNIALLTTIIDFSEDQDIENSSIFEIVEKNISHLQDEIERYLSKAKSSEILLTGIKLVLLGPPNAGKSSILNILANKEAAIVSEIAGTTRDVIDIPLDIEGFKVVLGDTAGIRSLDQADTIEREGIRRAKEKSAEADFIMVVIDPTSDITDLKEHLKQINKKMVIVLNKQDLYDCDIDEFSSILDVPKECFKVVSCLNLKGIRELRKYLVDQFRNISSPDPITLSSRTQDLLENDVLYGFREFHKYKDDVVLATESLRQSVEGIGKITGEAIGIEEILGVVFSKFCIGK